MKNPRKEKSKTLYLYRHGETDWNVNGRVMGQLLNINTTFTNNGLKQINVIAEKLKKITFNVYIVLISIDLLILHPLPMILYIYQYMFVKN